MELRIIKIDVDNIRSIAKKIGAIKVKEENQINNIYDFKDGSLLKKNGYARIRIVEDLMLNKKIIYMGVKKLISNKKFKVMDEKETIIMDAEEGKSIFEALGLNLCASITKYRESYKYKNTLIEIDINNKSFCPFPYIEIESQYENEIEEVVRLLGYSMKDTTSKNIYEILKSEDIIGENTVLKGL